MMLIVHLENQAYLEICATRNSVFFLQHVAAPFTPLVEWTNMTMMISLCYFLFMRLCLLFVNVVCLQIHRDWTYFKSVNIVKVMLVLITSDFQSDLAMFDTFVTSYISQLRKHSENIRFNHSELVCVSPVLISMLFQLNINGYSYIT